MRNFIKSSTSQEEAALVATAQGGNLDAFNQLVLRYQNLAYGHAYALLGNPAQAEDATQEGFLRAFQALQTFRGTAFRSWLLKIVTNSAYDQLRRSQRHPTQPLFPEDEHGEDVESPTWLADPAPSVQELVEQHEISNQIYQALDELPDVFRSVLTLIDVNDMDYTEAAKALGVPIGTVKSRLARARLQMQKKLKKSVSDRHFCRTGQACFAV